MVENQRKPINKSSLNEIVEMKRCQDMNRRAKMDYEHNDHTIEVRLKPTPSVIYPMKTGKKSK